MKFKVLLHVIFSLFVLTATSQDAWKIKTANINPSDYYGVTVANGMIGIVSSPEPFKVKDVVLAGAYDLYGRGRVSNFLKSFNLLSMYLEIDGKRMDAKAAMDMTQELDMKGASFTTTFNYSDKATVTYTYYSLRHLPYTVLMDLYVTAKKDINITSAKYVSNALGNPGNPGPLVLGGSGPWSLATNQSIVGGGVHNYNIRVTVTLNLNDANGDNRYDEFGKSSQKPKSGK